MEQQVTLPDMLFARERRAARQKELLAAYPMPLVCFTMNIAGPVKNSALIRRGFGLGKRYLRERMDAMKIRPVHFEEIDAHTGNEACYLIDLPPLALKSLTSDIEDGSLVGRLFDLDVLRPDGTKIDRTELGLPPRRCLICGGPARECARSRTHTVAELQDRTTTILKQALTDTDAKDAARLACRALLYEVGTTPKPGLVDRANSGSHADMDFFTFMDSASALWPYFETCTRIGRETAASPAPDTFLALRRAGRKAEADMFAATKGVNTHKGAVFSMGILCAALGRLERDCWKNADDVLNMCAAMTAGLTASDFAGLTEETAHTAGQRLYLRYGIRGVRGQMEDGLPAVRNVGLPVLKEGTARGLSLNDAGCAALLALIANAADTNMIARSDRTAYQETAAQLQALLARMPYPDRQTLEKLDTAFIQANLSPGGSADLLAICYLLYFLEYEV